MHSTTCSAILDTSTSSLAPQWKPKSPQKQTFISIRGLFTPGVTLFHWADTLNLLLQSHIIFSENKVAALATYTYVSLIAHLQTAFITNAWCQPKHRIKWLNEWELNAIKKANYSVVLKMSSWMYVHASERDRVPSFSHSATFSRLKGSKEWSLANKTQYREYLCPSACAHGHFITKKNWQ